MRKYYFLLISCLLLSYGMGAFAQSSPKHEMRAAWLYTVYGLDWPSTLIPVNGTETQKENARKTQKNALISYLNNIQATNLNTVFFQVRSCCDAMYKSAYEPWSGWLVSSRGGDPGWDPLEFMVDECHKRGLALHVWVDPYRYEINAGAWNGTIDPGYSVTHPEWIYQYNNFNVLNPGIPEVRQRVVEVVKDIITHYDVDGVALNDYFYVNNGGSTDDRVVDYDLYLERRESASQSQDDWRRENVSSMVGDVYDMVKATKPYVLCGVSPSGEACTNQAMADKYGVDLCTSGWDWQYGYIFSEPLAWLSRGKVDYLFPQIYWTIGYTVEDFSVLAPWWQKVASQFGRHNYVKHSLNGIVNGTKEVSDNLALAIGLNKATGPNSANASEYVNEIKLVRSSSINGATGQGFFKTSDITRTKGFMGYLVENVYQHPALPPAITWQSVPMQGVVKNLAINGTTLQWDNEEGMRYSVYAIPESVTDKKATAMSDYLLGMSYANSYDIPEAYQTGYKYAVAIFDRYNVEHAPMYVGATESATQAVTLTYPENNGKMVSPSYFKWSEVEDATYRVEIAEDAAFTKPLCGASVDTNKLSSVKAGCLKDDVTYYWRVITVAPNAPEVVSEISAFSLRPMVFTAPEYGATEVEPTLTLAWDNIEGVDGYQLQISANQAFTTLAVDATSSTNSYSVPEYKLAGNKKYYARVKFYIDGDEQNSELTTFTVKAITAEVPVILSPVASATVNDVDVEVKIRPDKGAAKIELKVSDLNTFPTRTSGSKSLTDFEFTHVFTAEAMKSKFSQSQGFVNGATYYLQARAGYYNTAGGSSYTYTDWCAPVAFVYNGGSGVEDVVSDKNAYIIYSPYPALIISDDTATDVVAEMYTVDGKYIKNLLRTVNFDKNAEINLSDVENGVYLLKVNINGKAHTLRFIKL